ncbi:MAG: deoxynucleoside kinase [Candidatus Lokiarchaeota archaeon]
MGRKIYRNKGSKDNIIISLAGVHGVGKTTIFHLFKKKMAENRKFKFFPERYRKIPPFPFGSADKQIAFRSEIHFLQQFIRRNKNIINYDNKYNGRIIILDRTPMCVLVYSKSLSLKEKDYNLIEDTYNSVDWKEHYIFYLTAEPNTILRRIIQRGAIEKRRRDWNEVENEYLVKILSFYNQLLLAKNQEGRVYIINTEGLNEDQVLERVMELITELTGYSFKKEIDSPSTQMNIIKFLK